MNCRAGAGLLLLLLQPRSGTLCVATRLYSSAYEGRATAAAASSPPRRQQQRRNTGTHTRRPQHRTELDAGRASFSAVRRTPQAAPRGVDSAEVLDALLALSSALYEDEAAATAVDVARDATATAPPMPVAPQPDYAYATVEAANLMDLMDDAAGQGEPLSAPQPPLLSSEVASAASQAPIAAASHVSAVFAAADVPLEQKVLQFMDLCSAPATSSPARAALPPAAAALVLPGLDMKAVLAHGAITQRHLRCLNLARCDFSLVRWSRVTVEDCDLSRSLFYRAALDGVTFRRCRFTGSILKGVHCGSGGSATASATAAVRFEDCDFRLAAMGLMCGDTGTAGTRRGPPVQFLRCNFDLSDFQFSEGLGDPSMFVRCSNTDLASHFPLRARGGVG